MTSPLKGRTNLSKSIKKTQNWLGVGDHFNVTIIDVDPEPFEATGQLQITFEKDQQTHKESIFFLNKQRTDTSWKMSNLLGAVFPGPEIGLYYQWLTEDDWEDALQFLRGMHLDLEIGLGSGYVIEFNPDTHKYEAIENNEVLCEHKQFDVLGRICRARSHKKAYRRVEAFKACSESAVSELSLIHI